MKKIIFIARNPFLKIHAEELYISQITEYFETEAWDLNEIYGKRERSNLQLFNPITIIQSEEEFESKLKEEAQRYEVIIVTSMTNNYLHKVYKIIKKYNIPIVHIGKEQIADYFIEKGRKKIIEYGLYKECIRSKIKRCLKPRGKKTYYKFDYLLAPENLYEESNNEFLKIHHIKYDTIKLVQDKERIVKERYILFIDTGASRHPMMKFDEDFDHQYLNKMNIFFDYLEKKYQMPVIISSHPKVQYSDEDFHGRKIINGMTSKLIKECEAVVTHYSTSIVEAMLMYKPIIIIVGKMFLKSAYYNYIIAASELAKEIGSEPFDICKPQDVQISMDRKKYDEFLKKHVYDEEHMECTNKELIVIRLNYIFNTWEWNRE